MSCVGIFASGLVSGSYYNGGGASDIKALYTSKSNDIQFVPHKEHPVLGVKTAVNVCLFVVK